jgi:hypothetical protein
MKKQMFVIMLIGVLLEIGLFSFHQAFAEVNVKVGVKIPPPPPFVIPAPPPVVVIPKTYVYVVPDIDVNILFYHGYWYRPHQGHWYRSRSYNGPWTYLPPGKVPRPILDLPPDYHRVPQGYHRIPNRELKRNWSRWERERYWHRDREWREGWRSGHEGRGAPERGPKPRGHKGPRH